MANNSDVINGLFETAGAFMVCFSIIRLYHDKHTKGISLWATVFFVCWGYWNCIFYPENGLTFSFFGGALLAISNTIWVIQMIYYSKFYKHGIERN